MRVLIVEDDEVLSDGLTVGLRLQGFSPEAVATCADASHALGADRFEAMVSTSCCPTDRGSIASTRARSSSTLKGFTT